MPEENGSTHTRELPSDTQGKTETSIDVPQVSAGFRKPPNDTEGFGTVPTVAERRENHTLTVRETARMFEVAGVARTERSIINWCQPNRQGIARLDGYYDPNECKYFITPQSVETAIQEEIQRAKKSTEAAASEPFGNRVEPVKHPPATAAANVMDEKKFQELEREVLDLKITNRAKDIVIDRMQKERDGFIDQLLAANRKVGELQSRVLHIE